MSKELDELEALMGQAEESAEEFVAETRRGGDASRAPLATRVVDSRRARPRSGAAHNRLLDFSGTRLAIHGDSGDIVSAPERMTSPSILIP